MLDSNKNTDKAIAQEAEFCILKNTVERSIVKAYISFVKSDNIPVALVCFALDASSYSEEKLENILMLLEQKNDYAPIFQCTNGLFFTFFKNIQLHHSVHILKEFNQSIEKLYNVSLSYAALTIIANTDTYEMLISRINKYINQAHIAGDGKISYGTSQYDFSTKKDEEDILKNFFISSSHVKIYNFYNGIPLSEEAKILSYSNGMLRIKVSFGKATFLKYEPFTFLRHELLPDTLKADIINTYPKQGETVLSNLRFIEKSPVDRENIRVKPDIPINVSVEHNNGPTTEGTVQSISVNTISIKFKQGIPDSYFKAKNARFRFIFKLQGANGKITNIRIFGIYLAQNNDNIIFSIYMNRAIKQKIENYIELQQAKLMTIVQKMVLDFYQK